MDQLTTDLPLSMGEVGVAEMPQYPKPTGNARADSLARAEYERQLTAHFERTGGGFQSYTTPRAEGTAPSGVQPNADDLAVINEVRADLYKRFPSNNQARAVLERALVAVFEGRPLDREAFAEELDRAVETSADRATKAAVERLAQVVDGDGRVASEVIPEELLHGYSLPTNYTFEAEELLKQLRLARKAGLTNEQVVAIIEATATEEY